MATVFGDSQGVISINYLGKDKMTTELYYAIQALDYDVESRKKATTFSKKNNYITKVTSTVARQIISVRLQGATHLQHSPYSVLSGFFLFPN